MMRVAFVFYGVMATAGVALVAWRRGARHLFDPMAPPREGWAVWAGAALALVLGVHVLTRIAVRHSVSMRRAAADAGAWFGGLGLGQLWVLAGVSGLAEELFFRGWLLNEVGLVASSLIFGVIHVPPARHWWAWPVFAAAVGYALGGLCLGSGTLLFAILAHTGINGVNLALIAGRRQERAGP